MWLEVCVKYVIITNFNKNLTETEQNYLIDEYSQVWPLQSIIPRIWIWDFRNFIVDQENMKKILDFFREIRRIKGNEE